MRVYELIKLLEECDQDKIVFINYGSGINPIELSTLDFNEYNKYIALG